MFALHLRTKKRLEFWQVEKDNDRPIWANQAFTDGGFRWNSKSLSIQNVGGLLKWRFLLEIIWSSMGSI